DGSVQKLSAGTLVIADDSKALAMAGIMGGDGSAVDEQTRDIFLESAFFEPMAIVGRARSYGLHTDSSHRFERGVDPQLCVQAMERATALLLAIVGGEPGPVVCEELPEHLPAAKTVAISSAKLASQLGMVVDAQAVTDIFQRLGFRVLEADADGWQLEVPSWRFDIAIPVDLVEEVARIHGYNTLPTTTMTAPMAIAPRAESRLDRDALKLLLVDRGFREAITYSFVDPELMAILDPQGAPIQVANPIASDM